MKETKTEKDFWDGTKELLGHYQVTLQPQWKFNFSTDPKTLSFLLSRCKFAAKMACKEKTVLELGCEQGMGAALLGEFATTYLGIDTDANGIALAQANHPYERYRFTCDEYLGKKYGNFEAVIGFDALESLSTEGQHLYVRTVVDNLAENGVAVIGSISPFEDQLQQFFHQVFPFGMQDEIVHTATTSSCSYRLYICCHKKLSSGFLSSQSIGICDEVLPTFSEIHSQRTMDKGKSAKDRAKPSDCEGDKPRTQVKKD